MTETLRDKLIRCGWVTNFNADTLVKLIERHYAALAQPEPQGPTDEVDHILKLAAIIREVDGGNKLGAASLAEAILSHRDNCWGRPAIEPVPVAERLPGQEDCDAEGRCWWWHPDHKEDEFTDGWMSLDPKWADGHHDADDSPGLHPLAPPPRAAGATAGGQ
jgi:hypothetical protein